MFHELVNHNPDFKRLVDRGFAVSFEPGFLIILDVPYLDAQGAEQTGAIVSKMLPVDLHRMVQDDHQVYFCGSHPHNIDGSPVRNLAGGMTTMPLERTDVVVERSFSNKPGNFTDQPGGGFPGFYEKISHYVGLISGPAIAKHGADPYTYRCDENFPESVFKFQDSLSSRAEIGDLSRRLSEQVVAIVGLGGTGSYLLDFLSKTPVKKIHIYDPDKYHVHNAFRSPGHLEGDELDRRKAEVYLHRYDNFRTGLTAEILFVDEETPLPEDLTFAFVCVDKGSSRNKIFTALAARNLPFIDVGMGLDRKSDALNGMLRTTYYSPEDTAGRRAMMLAETFDPPGDEYRANIQISELNALNAALAVIKFKKLLHFYHDTKNNFHTLFCLDSDRILGLQS